MQFQDKFVTTLLYYLPKINKTDLDLRELTQTQSCHIKYNSESTHLDTVLTKGEGSSGNSAEGLMFDLSLEEAEGKRIS